MKPTTHVKSSFVLRCTFNDFNTILTLQSATEATGATTGKPVAQVRSPTRTASYDRGFSEISTSIEKANKDLTADIVIVDQKKCHHFDKTVPVL